MRLSGQAWRIDIDARSRAGPRAAARCCDTRRSSDRARPSSRCRPGRSRWHRAPCDSAPSARFQRSAASRRVETRLRRRAVTASSDAGGLTVVRRSATGPRLGVEWTRVVRAVRRLLRAVQNGARGERNDSRVTATLSRLPRVRRCCRLLGKALSDGQRGGAGRPTRARDTFVLHAPARDASWSGCARTVLCPCSPPSGLSRRSDVLSGRGQTADTLAHHAGRHARALAGA